MPGKKLGRQTMALGGPVSLVSGGCVAGKLEGEGPLGEFFDQVDGERWVTEHD